MICIFWGERPARLFLKLMTMLLFCFPLQGNTKQILADLNFAEGQWTMIGVSTYNYHPLPIQDELGSFKLQDINVLKHMQKKWNVTPFYEDNCEYHYVLKFYNGKDLVKTLKVNLYCNYITEDVFSYRFEPEWITEMRSAYQKIQWKNVRFNNLNALRKVIDKAKKDTHTFLYHDVRPYLHDGFFIASSPNLDWNINRDSVIKAMENKIAERTGTKDFHLVAYLFYINDEWKISFRYVIYCNENVAKKYKSADVTADWRHHFAFNQAGDQDIELMILGAVDY